MATSDQNNMPYFIVGGLVVLAIVFGFIYFYTVDPAGRGVAGTSPAAGTAMVDDGDPGMEVDREMDGIRGPVMDQDTDND